MANTRPNINETKKFATKLEPFLWFLLPSEAIQYLNPHTFPDFVKTLNCPFSPKQDFANDKSKINSNLWARGSIPYEICSVLQNDSNHNMRLSTEEVAELFKTLRLKNEESIAEGKLNSKSRTNEGSYSSGFVEDFQDWKCNYCKSSNVRRLKLF